MSKGTEFSIDKDTIDRKVNHDGRIYYDFYVSKKGTEVKGKFQYWPFKSVPNSAKCDYVDGYVEIYDYCWNLGDGPMLDLADNYLTKWMKNTVK